MKSVSRNPKPVEIRDKMIYIDMPDGRNFFMGVKEMPVKNKFGIEQPMKYNIWGDFTDCVPNEGIFTATEAKFYRDEIIGTETDLTTFSEETKRRNAVKN